MAEKRPLCQYSGTIEELRSGDTLPGGGSSGGAGAIGIAPEYITADKTLTATSSGYQIVDSANSAEYALTLPDATTIDEGAIMFIVQNDSGFALALKADSGGAIGSIAAGVTAAFSLEDNATTDGVWKRTFGYAPSGSDVVIGDDVVFESASSDYISVTTLSSSQALVCYRDGGNSYFGTACILDISGSTITPGTPVVFESANLQYISVTTLSSTQAIVCYADTGNSYFGTACILDISGSTITPGTPVVFESANSQYISVTTLSSSRALVCYKDTGNLDYGTARILNISGSTITPAGEAVFEYATSEFISVTTLSSNQALVCCMDQGNNNYGTACILNISGSTITRGTPVVFESTYTQYISVTTLSSTQAIVCYTDNGNGRFGMACILDVSGSLITTATPVVFEDSDTRYISVTTLSSSRALVCYQNTGNSSYGTACILDISGSLITTTTPVVFESANTQYTSVTTLSSSQALVCYRDDGNSYFGTSRTMSLGI